MNFYKDERIAEAIKISVRNFGKKNNLNGADYFGEQFGFNGDNVSVQFYNYVNPSNLQKDLTLGKFFFMLNQMDHEDRKIVLDAFGDKYGFYVKEKEEGEKQSSITLEATITMGTLGLGSTMGVINDDVLQSIEDGKIDEAEAKRLLRGLKEMEKKTRSIEDALTDFLGF